MKQWMRHLSLPVGLAALSWGGHALAASPLAFGIEAGVNFGNASTPSQISADARTGYSAGVNLDIPLGSIFTLQPELLFAQRSTSLADANGVRVKASFDSLQLPVMLKARFGERVAPYLFAGPVATYNLSKSVTAEAAGATSAVAFSPSAWDFGVAGGAGLDLGPFFLNARYNLGLVDIDTSGASFKSRGFQFLAGLRLGG